jgi:CDP-diacylglycerol--serine O-phosphatidyltransferase
MNRKGMGLEIKPGAKQRRFRRRLAAYRSTRVNRTRRRIPRSAVPSFFTLMNLFCGFLSVTRVIESDFESAAWLIVLAGFFDLLDGMMARLTNGTSLFGVELDSLADIVSFGVAPSLMIYVFGLSTYGIPGVIVSSLPAICGAVRLAKFNVSFEGKKSDYFDGLPIPAQAWGIVSIVLNAENVDMLTPIVPGRLPILIPVVVILSGLMLSTISFDSPPPPSARYMRGHPVKTVLLSIALVLILIYHELGLLIVLTSYIAIGMGRAVFKFVYAVVTAEPQDGTGIESQTEDEMNEKFPDTTA